MSFFKIYKLKKSIFSIIYLPIMEYHARWALSIQILLRSKKITLLTLKCWGCRFYWRRHSLLPLIITGMGSAIHCTDAATAKSQLKKAWCYLYSMKRTISLEKTSSIFLFLLQKTILVIPSEIPSSDKCIQLMVLLFL